MSHRRLALAFALALLLPLAACQDGPPPQESAEAPAAAPDSGAPAADATDASPADTASDSPTAGSAPTAGDSSTDGDSPAADDSPAAGGIDTTGTGPASIPEDRYTTTSSGLKYYDFREGTGASPEPTDRVRVHYTGWLQSNGRKFDSSYDRGQPATFPLNGVIKGWTEGLQSMQVGGKRQLVIPANLAYGSQGRPGIPPDATLVFEVELMGIEG